MMVNLNSKYVKSVSVNDGVNNLSDLPYLNAICKSSANRVRYVNCEMQEPEDHGTTVDDTAHWPRQNYEKDHISNVRRLQCGCGEKWSHDDKGNKQPHNNHTTTTQIVRNLPIMH